MTQKELLYLEDAVGHEKNIVSVLTETINLLEDEDLIEFIREELEIHQDMEKNIEKLLEENANE